LQNNLLSVLHLVANHRFRIEIKGKEMVFLQSDERCFTAAICDNTAWLNASSPPAPKAALRGEATLNHALWHRRLCHIGADRLEQVIKGKVATGVVVKSNTPALSHCEPCIRGKHHRDPFPQRASHCATSFLERIHSNLHQLPVLTSSGCRYWLLFIDDCSRYFWIYLLQKKSETFDAFTQFKTMVKKQCNKSILCLHDDKGGEFIGIKWDAFFAQHGIWCEHMVKAPPQQNGIAKRLNRTLEELLVVTLNGARLPARFWGEGLKYLRHVLCAARRAQSLRAPHPTRWYTSVSPTTCPYACSAAAPGRTSSARSERASRTTPSCASSSAVLRTSRAGSCGTRPPTVDAAVSSSRATSCGTRGSSPACCVSHTTPFPSASAVPQSLVMPSAHLMTRRSLT
jgi:transposase InsO family protein